MRHIAGVVAFFCLFLGAGVAQPPATVVFWEDGFPTVDTAAPDRAALASLPGATIANAQQLPQALAAARLLVIHGSAFPEEAWPAIYEYLQRGGNLLAIGGRPFMRAAYRDCVPGGACQWKLRYERKAFAYALMINDYTETPGSRELRFVVNDRLPGTKPSAFDYNRAWSLTVKLSAEQLYNRGGSTGTIDARLDTLAWGVRDGRKLSAPVIELDHMLNNFVGGRWLIVAAELPAALPPTIVTALAHRALAGALDFTFRPQYALFLPGETPSFNLRLRRFGVPPLAMRLEVTDMVARAESATTVPPDAAKTAKRSAALVAPRSFDLPISAYPFFTSISLPGPAQPGLHVVVASLFEGNTVVGQYRTGYWVRDDAYLRSGPAITLDKDFFLENGRPIPVVGTTYMSSDVQRQYLMQPNPYVWNEDFADMRANGMNMIRTGLWTAYDQVMKEPGVMHESALRNLEAFLMTARRHNMPVQFNLMAFIPDVFGGANPYLDPEALRRQREFTTAIVSRFKDVPWLIWDYINEPSFDKPTHLWATRPNGDKFELERWNEFLKTVHRDNAAAANAWNTLPASGPLPPPAEDDFSAGIVYRGGKPLPVHDFYQFAQREFTNWTKGMTATVRATGSKQLVTVGQDEGGGNDRLNPSFWVDAVDFTTNHSWWFNDALLWDSLFPKLPGKPLLIQETGLQNDFQMDATWRRSPQNQANVLERKSAVALATSAGVINWLWNVNSYMTEDQEVTIGVIRVDGTDKPEAAVMRGLAQFANTNRDAFHAPEQPQVAIITSQGLQFSPLSQLAVTAQWKAVRVLHNYLNVPGYMIAENRVAQMGQPKLAILPSPHALADATWKVLMDYVSSGGTLLITGSPDRDPYWRHTERLKALNIDAHISPINFRQGAIDIDGKRIPVSYADQAWIDELRFADGSTWKEITIGRGKLLITSYPVEMSEGNDATAAVYAAALQRAAVQSPYEVRQLSPGVLVRPVFFADSVLYLLMSESGREEAIDVRDKLTGAEIKLTVPEQRALLLLLNKKDGRTLARYGY